MSHPVTSAAAPAPTSSDPVIAWLERIRDFVGATDQARAFAQQAIDWLKSADAPQVRP